MLCLEAFTSNLLLGVNHALVLEITPSVCGSAYLFKHKQPQAPPDLHSPDLEKKREGGRDWRERGKVREGREEGGYEQDTRGHERLDYERAK